MMEKIEKFLREMGAFTTSEAVADMENDDLYDKMHEVADLSAVAKELHHEFTALMEVGVFKMEPKSGQTPHFDIAVSIKDGDGNIHEVEDFENVQAEEIDAKLDELSAKYPRATVLYPRGEA
jgi:uncharacterized protein YbaA (DUF1428 family)